MEFPIQVEFDLIQEDFIQVEILEQLFNAQDNKKQYLINFYWQIGAMLLAAAIIYISPGIINTALVFPMFFAFCFLLNFLYRYFVGYKNEASMAISHVIESDAKGNVFFSEEKGMALFYQDNGEYLSNEQRRFYNYSQIQHIKITKRLIIFVMKPNKEKGLRGFVYMVLPIRDLSVSQYENILVLCEIIKEKYNLKPWIENTVID